MLRFVKSPFLLSLAIGLAGTVLLALLAGAASFIAIDAAVERGAKEDIIREVRILTERSPERDVLSDTASLTTALGRRMFQEGDDSAQSLYLLVDANKTPIVGNVAHWPNNDARPGSWKKTNGQALGIESGPVLLRIEEVSGGEFGLLVGRKLTAQAALRNRFVPVLALSVLCLGAGMCALLLWLHRRYQRKILAFNDVFSLVRQGDFSARVSESELTSGGAELSVLGDNINLTLSELQRLMSSLDAYSQVAAHELNHAVSKMRDRFIASGNSNSAQDADDLLELVAQILDLAKVETTPGFAMQTFDIVKTVNTASDLFEDTFEEEGVMLIRDIPDEIISILGSEPLVTSAIVNLLSNSAKHAPHGTSVTVSIVRTHKHLGVSVQDQGPGLVTTDISELSRLASQQGREGHGFGLRHVQAVAIRHGARLALQNTQPGLKAEIVFQQSGSNQKG